MDASQTLSSIPDIVIVGGGAGGLELATKLGNKLGKKGRARITLIDSTRTHIWKPLLHQVASGASDPADHALEYLAQASWHGFQFRLGTMDGLDRVAKKIHLAPVYNESGEMIIPEREFPYDTLVLSVGSVGNDFGIPGVKEHCLFLDTKAQAVGFQKKLLETLIRVNTQQRKVEAGQLDVAIVGGGATGVELAAQLHQVTRQLTQYGLDVVNPDSDIRISVIDAGARVLPMLPEHISAQVTRELAKLGIDVISQAKVTKVSPAGIEINNDKVIPAAISVWAAGIKAPEFLSTLGLETNRINQVIVKRNLLSESDDHIFALGDCAAFPKDEKGMSVPPRAQAAHQQASFVARAICRRIRGNQEIGEYVYRDFGSLITLGRYSTVGSLMSDLTGSVKITGFFARLVYLSLYKMHQFALHGLMRTGLLTLAQLLRRTVDPSIKLH